MEILRDGSLRQVAVLRLEGYNQDEIAAQLDVTRRTVERSFNSYERPGKLTGGNSIANREDAEPISWNRGHKTFFH